ncbi:MAG: hypothetical protein GWM87_07960, partial [Xanthomonadales bacterium]|nr:hypothetical protein [Xanthomonadales bacterium]NIX12874.1 hypothetical protein [Xanthomonadales bacterium]
LAFLLSQAASANEREWRFRVWLDDKKVGYHEFLLVESEGVKRLRSEASFEYRLMFVKLYEYLHENTETWRDGCLLSIESRTDANGKPYQVRGGVVGDRFYLEEDGSDVEFPACVMSFAYWNPEFLQQERLLNAQNGDLLEVRVSEPETDELVVRGERREALRYRLQAGELDIALWYSEDREWLALETEARGGRKLRYELL